MSLFRRRRPVPAAARTALRDPVFACSTPGVAAVHVDYDAAVWVRAPTQGQDRSAWAEAHLAAYASDLGLTDSDALYQRARVALDRTTERDLGHTCDFVSLQGDGAETGAIAYVDVVDEEAGLRRYGDPETFVTMADLAAQGAKPNRPDHFPMRRQPRSWWTSDLQSLDPETLVTTWIRRAHRRAGAGAGPAVHLYAGGFHSQPTTVGPMLHLFTRVDLQLAQLH